uniref:Uncharacterized protein n=1 Tax=Anguilla anguilla TaxID=7936 RepID=A0A0E9PKW5_ANGAN
MLKGLAIPTEITGSTQSQCDQSLQHDDVNDMSLICWFKMAPKPNSTVHIKSHFHFKTI